MLLAFGALLTSANVCTCYWCLKHWRLQKVYTCWSKADVGIHLWMLLTFGALLTSVYVWNIADGLYMFGSLLTSVHICSTAYVWIHLKHCWRLHVFVSEVLSTADVCNVYAFKWRLEHYWPLYMFVALLTSVYVCRIADVCICLCMLLTFESLLTSVYVCACLMHCWRLHMSEALQMSACLYMLVIFEALLTSVFVCAFTDIWNTIDVSIYLYMLLTFAYACCWHLRTFVHVTDVGSIGDVNKHLYTEAIWNSGNVCIHLWSLGMVTYVYLWTRYQRFG